MISKVDPKTLAASIRDTAKTCKAIVSFLNVQIGCEVLVACLSALAFQARNRRLGYGFQPNRDGPSSAFAPSSDA